MSERVKVIGTEVVPVGSLKPHPSNPNRGDVKALARSLEAFGQFRAILVDQDSVVLAGHHVWAAAMKNKQATIRVERLEVDADKAKAIMLADNRLAELGPGIDPVKLYEVLADLTVLEGTGYSSEDLAALELELTPPIPKGDPDSAEPLPKGSVRPIAGSVWALGPHRLAVGSATDGGLLDRLLEHIDAPFGLVTDPPYGVSYVGKTADAMKIVNDELTGDALEALIEGALRNVNRVMSPGGPWYLFGPSGEGQFLFRRAVRSVGWQVRSECIWVKNMHVLGRQDYQSKHETLISGGADPEVDWEEQPPEGHDVALYGWKKGASHRWLGDRRQTTVWEHPKPAASKDHPTMKPVELIAGILRNSIPPGAVVLDVFAGSGTIMAAAHITNRRAAMIELDPKYAEVILRRWENLTGLPVEEVTYGNQTT